MSFIYKTTNLINGKIYIGQHSGNCRTYLGSGVKLLNSINVHGRENFEREILHDNITTQKALDILERHYIKKYDSCNPKIGYNILAGSANGFGQCNPACLPEIRKKISEAAMGRVISEKTRLAVSLRHKGSITPENVRLAISKSKSNKKCSTDGVKNLYRDSESELPAGWRWGRLPYTVKRKKDVNKINYGMTLNKIWITNEIKDVLINKTGSVPEGWRRGMKFVKRNKKSKLK